VRVKLTVDRLRQRDRIVLTACRAAGVPIAASMAGGCARDVEAIMRLQMTTIGEAAQSPALREVALA
jgi:hypothetical protein